MMFSFESPREQKSEEVSDKLLPSERGSEGITPEHLVCVNRLIDFIDTKGVKTECVIVYGSRAREQAKENSDLDVIFFIDYSDISFIDDSILTEVEQRGGKSIEISIPDGAFHILFLDSRQAIKYLKLMSPLLRFNKFIKDIALDARVIYGKEPIISGKPLIEYIKQRAKLKSK